jgi:hypothetical protein
MRLNLRDLALPRSNVIAVLREPDRPTLSDQELMHLLVGKKVPGVVDFRHSHNIVTNMGRQFLRNGTAAASFPSGPYVADEDLGTPYSVITSGGDKKTYRVRYMALGVGGQLQNVGPPPAGPGPGTFAEEQWVDGLERPYTVSGLVTPGPALWMKQVEPHSNLSDTQLVPDEYTFRWRCIFEQSDVTYPGSEDSYGVSYGTGYSGLAVPVSEVMLFSSQADPWAPPQGGVSVPALGSVAYNIFPSITLTPNFVFEVGWSFLW